MADDFLEKPLEKRRAENSLRSLRSTERLIDFCSNDYLGFARSEELHQRIRNFRLPEGVINLNGSGGSRLINGNTFFAEELEREIAEFHGAETGLIYNSGYDANIGLFSCVPQRGDTVLYDELSHASIRDGIRLSLAQHFSFRHNDIRHLEELIRKGKGKIFVAAESVYSMDGDFAPLEEMVRLCEKYGASLVVDEAHATGIFGPSGRGKINELHLEKRIFARVHTFGKALGVHGAVVLGSSRLRNYLINFSRSFIYTTALPLHSLIAIKCAYERLLYIDYNLLNINELIRLFKSKVNQIPGIHTIPSLSPVQCVLIPGNDRVKSVASALQGEGFDVRPILSPTVQNGKERLRICLHTFNTREEVTGLLNQLHKNL